MSGKKAGDVSSLLSKGHETRKISENNLNKTIKNCKQDIENAIKNCSQIENLIFNAKNNLTNEAISEFKSETDKINNKFNALSNTKYSNNFSLDSIEKTENQNKTRLAELDAETKRLQKVIKEKPHYCDPEYKEAQVVFNNIKDISNNRNNLANKTVRLKDGALKELANLKNIQKQQQSLISQIDSINKKAENIVALRQKSTEIKSFISTSINAINQTDANKFMPNEYTHITSLKDKINALNDNEVLKVFDGYEAEISAFSLELNNKKEAFEKEKSEVLDLINNNNELLTFDSFYDGLEYSRKKEDAQALHLIEYLNEYAKGEYVEDINKSIADCKVAFEKEDFAKVRSFTTTTRDLIEKAINYAKIKQENIYNNVTLSIDVNDVMVNLGYIVNSTIVGKNVSEGFRIECSVGDEIIDFEQILVNDDGQVELPINHTESVSGTCGHTWGQLQEAFLDKGILLKDVNKNGHSVINKKANPKSQKSAEQQRGV